MKAKPRGRSVRFFTNTCATCANDVGIPLLGDFAYGEMIIQTADGKHFAFAEIIAEDAWTIIGDICKSEFGLDSTKVTPAHDVFTRVGIRCADPYEGQPYSTTFPLCPQCGAILTHYGDAQISHDGHIPRVTWERFMGLSTKGQRKLVRDYWNNECGQPTDATDASLGL